MAYNVAVDVGGTFTDVLVFDEQTGELTDTKVLSTTEDPSEGVVTGIERTCDKVGKVPALLTLEAGSRWAEIDPRISPREKEPVLNKLFASAFFGTGLSSLLTAAGVDTLIVTGATTSGCVRATVVDALQYGFRPVVPREAVGDRNPDAHEANLYDVDAKYGDVVYLEEVLKCLEEKGAAHAR